MSSWSAENQDSNADDITFPPSQTIAPSINLASTGTAQTSDSDDSGGPPPNSNNGEDEARREEDSTTDAHTARACTTRRTTATRVSYSARAMIASTLTLPRSPKDVLSTPWANENQQYDFMAGNATYCENTDAQCLLCRATAFAEIIYHHSDYSRSRYCVGQNGCVCVAICEGIEVNHQRPDKRCMINAMSTTDRDTSVNQFGSIAAILGAMCFIVASVFVIYRIRKRGESSASDGENDKGVATDLATTVVVAMTMIR
ncbi:hypothetical protein GQ600_5435 [Phytophthora cactorum]|nr:hypothetical protein GQ600_5435 [Phytophthora cactorum]